MLDKIFLQKKILTEQNYITKEDGEKAEAYEGTGRGSFADYLLQEGILNKDTFAVPYNDCGFNGVINSEQ